MLVEALICGNQWSRSKYTLVKYHQRRRHSIRTVIIPVMAGLLQTLYCGCLHEPVKQEG